MEWVNLNHPGYDVDDQEVIDFWRSQTGVPESLIEEVIKRDLAFKHAPPLEWDGVKFCEQCRSYHPHFKNRSCHEASDALGPRVG